MSVITPVIKIVCSYKKNKTKTYKSRRLCCYPLLAIFLSPLKCYPREMQRYIFIAVSAPNMHGNPAFPHIFRPSQLFESGIVLYVAFVIHESHGSRIIGPSSTIIGHAAQTRALMMRSSSVSATAISFRVSHGLTVITHYETITSVFASNNIKMQRVQNLRQKKTLLIVCSLIPSRVNNARVNKFYLSRYLKRCTT